jgi:hypothetical protein
MKSKITIFLKIYFRPLFLSQIVADVETRRYSEFQEKLGGKPDDLKFAIRSAIQLLGTIYFKIVW